MEVRGRGGGGRSVWLRGAAARMTGVTTIMASRGAVARISAVVHGGRATGIRGRLGFGRGRDLTTGLIAVLSGSRSSLSRRSVAGELADRDHALLLCLRKNGVLQGNVGIWRTRLPVVGAAKVVVLVEVSVGREAASPVVGTRGRTRRRCTVFGSSSSGASFTRAARGRSVVEVHEILLRLGWHRSWWEGK